MSRILLVENRQESSELVANKLCALGHEVYHAHSGAAAIAHVETCGADVLILDLEMPRLDGWQVLQWLRARPSAPPIIVHSRLAAPQWKLARQLGAAELWPRGSCTLTRMCDSLEKYTLSQLARAA
jgi:CheY-like chemotaxis protein